MSSKPPQPSKEERLARALRDNLARRKALVRAKRQRAGAEEGATLLAAPAAAGGPKGDDASS